MRRNCPLSHLPACAGLADPALCDPEQARELAARSLYLASLAGWPAVGGMAEGQRVCPREFPDPEPEPDPEPVPALEPTPEPDAAAAIRAAKPRGSLADAIRWTRAARGRPPIPGA